MELTELEQIGLKQKEAKIYLALLKSGQSLANQLAKQTNILRSSIYDYLDILLEKGFITYTIQSNKKYFQAVSPEKILENFKEQKQKQEQSLNTIIPELTKIMNTEPKKVNIEVFQGKEGIKTVFSSLLREKPKEVFGHGSSGASYHLLPFFMEHWHKERARKKIFLRLILNDVTASWERLRKGPKIKFGECRLVNRPDPSLSATMVYNDKTLIIMFDPETPLAISIQSESIAKTHKQEFEILWKNSKKA